MLRATAAELGWLSLALPEKVDGLAMGVDGIAMLAEEFGASLTPGPLIPTLCVAQIVAEFAEDEQAASMLPPLIDGTATAAIEVDEGRAVLWGDPASAQLALLRGDGGGPRLVRLDPSVAPPGHALWDSTREMFDRSCGLETVLQLPAAAIDRAQAILDIAIAADSIGLARAALDQTIDYLNQREQFGRKIGAFQALKHRAADALVALELARHAQFHAVAATTADAPAAAAWCAASKAMATDMAARVTQDCLQLHGGIGFTWEYDSHLYVKRARLNQALGGDNVEKRSAAFGNLEKVLDTGVSLLEMVP